MCSDGGTTGWDTHVMGGKYIGPPPTVPPKKGLGFMPAMGLDGAVNKVVSEW